ncbi:competence protein ComGC [Lacticaseibacillus chiayiensis]|uniref:Competence protein ComGC n=1 Tax=Lacticaseibacillus chiayiensis TaxID=2100821 RepID=A0A4Q1TKB5_9LACO|nr:competence protein ComGC [Lacticaseibacillus chiayiensis]QVI35526.1 competence protein ComGC [Lacticaseibacillus chiayiensis]RXT18999.1 competence protein ComGC [Lacticaseibacillus chiayiensis]RXT59493.1 competence protein ComGC [Lacticaseibacillus chiayiensis]UYN57365.1 type IV pilus minor pilin ComGF family protein [Lacticaseibacillus chiayiensis]
MLTIKTRLSHLRLKAFSLIEVVVGLGLMMVILLLWQPLLTGIQRFTRQDQYLIHALRAEQDLQADIRSHKMKDVKVKESSVLLQGQSGAETKTYTFEFYAKRGSEGMIRTRSNFDGHVPLFMQIKSAKFQAAPQGFLYTLRLKSAQTFEGGVFLEP